MSNSVVNHRYEGRRRDIHGDITARLKSQRSGDRGLIGLFPSSRLLRRITLGSVVVGGGVLAGPAWSGADEIDAVTDGDLVVETGADDDDVSIEGDGDNTISTDGGEDEVVVEGDGNNTIDTGEDDDFAVVIGDGDNTIDAGSGDDEVIVGGQGDNTVDAGDGDDFVAIGGEGNNQISGGEGNDTLAGGVGDDTIDGGDGLDVIEGDSFLFFIGDKEPVFGDDVLSGGDGNDVILGDNDASAYLCASEGPRGPRAPRLVVASDADLCGDDTINGDAGNDWLEGNLGDDVIDGGEGSDLVVGDDLIFYFNDFEELAEAMLSGEIDGMDGLDEEDFEYLLGLLEEIGFFAPGGNDVVSGGPGADVVAGLNGHDIVCGDTEDLAVLGGGGTDVPCAVFEETLDASSGEVDGDLSTDMRDLDDEDYEVDEDGAHNPYEFVVDATLVSSSGEFDTYKTAKGTVVLNRNTGAFTYTADPGATGTEDITYTVRRRVVECADYEAFDLEEAYQPGCEDGDNGELELTAIVDVGGADYLYSLWRVFSVFLGDPPVVPDVPVVPPVQGVVPVQASQPVQLPKTGSDPEDLALIAMALLGLGGLAITESRRRLSAAANS